MKMAMISQPMKGKTDEEITETRNRAVETLHNMGFNVVDSYFHGENEPEVPETVVNKPLYYLGKSLEKMAECEMLYCCKGAEKARGCRIENVVATDYGLSICYEAQEVD